MTTVAELGNAKTPLGASLAGAVNDIAGSSSPITFTLYNRRILPIDGFVFWIRAGLDAVPPTAATTKTIQGSFHFQTEKIQEENDTYGLNRCIFTAEQPIMQGFEYSDPTLVYIGQFPDPQNPSVSLSFAFSQQKVYKQANLWHYTGDAIYPFMASQIVNDLADLPANVQIVSNSLPFWLSLNNYAPFYGFGNSVPLYPSSLVLSNIVPPFGSVHIVPESTTATAALFYMNNKSSQWQLATERVQITFYGLSNDTIMNFYACVVQYSTDYSPLGQAFGLVNSPIVQDMKVRQTELSVIGQKKTIEFEVSYFQQSARNVARQLIEEAFVTATPSWPTSWNVGVN